MNTFTWKLLDFDTNLFGFKTAKIDEIKTGSVPNLVSDLKKNGIRYATYRVHSNEISLIHELENNGFVTVDGYVALKGDMSRASDITDSSIRIAQANDVPFLKEIASTIFTSSRFYNDPLIPDEKGGEMFSKWIENSIVGTAADEVLVITDHGDAIGFITIQYSGHIPLVGVHKHHQGKGHAKKLIQAAKKKLKDKEIQNIQIETQLQNIPAMRSYLSSGFKVVEAFFTLRWSDL